MQDFQFFTPNASRNGMRVLSGAWCMKPLETEYVKAQCTRNLFHINTGTTAHYVASITVVVA